MTTPVLQPSVEAIAHQVDDKFFRALSTAFEEITSIKQLSKVIPEIIAEHTGIVTEFGVDSSDDPNAWVYSPDLNKNHPFLDDFRRQWYTGADASKLLKTEKAKYLTGSIDRAHSKVSGPFTKVVCPIFVTRGLLSGTHAGMSGQVQDPENPQIPKVVYGSRFTSKEIAAIVMHEVGHVFSYFESLADVLTTNWVLDAATQAFFKTDDITLRVKLIQDVEDALAISFSNSTQVAQEIRDAEGLHTVVLSETAKVSRSRLGANIYDLRSWENASDQFASRHGASLALASGLDKMYRLYGADDRHGKIAHWIGQIIGMMSMLFVTGIGIALVASGTILAVYGVLILLVMALAAFSNPFDDIYDPHKFRLGRIRQDVITRLKRHNLPKDYVIRTIREFDQLEVILKDVQHHETLWRKIWVFCSSTTRKQRDRINEQQELELLANNELFITAARFSVLV